MTFFFFKQKTAYEMRISDWSSDVCSSDLGSVAYTASIEGQVGQAGILRQIQVRVTNLKSRSSNPMRPPSPCKWGAYCASARERTPHRGPARGFFLPPYLKGQRHDRYGRRSVGIHELGRASCRERVCMSV